MDGHERAVPATPHSATYSYLANSPLISQVVFKQNTTTRMTTSKAHDNLNRLASIAAVGTGTTPSVASYLYSYNSANQRVSVALADGSYWAYEYDSLGQVKSGKRYWNDGTPVAGQQFEYAHDDIGNRTSTKAGGDAGGANLRSATYTPNRLNQYTQRTVPGAYDVMGAARGTVTITGTGSAVYRKDEFFRKEVTVVNSSVPVWSAVTVTATAGSSVNSSGNTYVPKTAEVYTYDLDGNVLTDGRWTYTWDGENRLTRLVPIGTVGPQTRIDFEYDWQGRRIAKKVWNNVTGTSGPKLSERFLYDGWNLVAQLNATNNAVVRSFVWGSDLSGSLQGAGGVGGLLAVKDTASGTHFAVYDGNGNVVALVSATDASVSARYEYGPFGELLRGSGTMAKLNPFRFSTKFQDDETDQLYYGYRYLSPSTGRWISRDPIEERGGRNLYGFAGNNSIKWIDPLGNDYGQGAGFMEKLRDCNDCGLPKSKKAAELAGQAKGEAQSRFPDNQSLNDGPGDAWRHCYWSCLMTRAIGERCAHLIAENHEVAGDEEKNQSEEARNMDENNNYSGRKLASQSGDCGDLCKKALDDGKLKVLKP